MSDKIYCFRCKKEIDLKSNYYSMVEMNNGKTVHIDYVHRNCWDEFMNSFNGASQSLKKSNFLLDAMGKKMMDMGLIDKPVMEVKC